MSQQFLSNLRRSIRQQGNQVNQKSPDVLAVGAYGTSRSRRASSWRWWHCKNISVSEDTGEKPQSKTWEHAGQRWAVMPNSSGTWVHRLDGTSWTPTVQISANNNIRADVKPIGDMAHVLLQDGSNAQLASLQYDAVDNRFEAWSLRPQLVERADEQQRGNGHDRHRFHGQHVAGVRREQHGGGALQRRHCSQPGVPRSRSLPESPRTIFR